MDNITLNRDLKGDWDAIKEEINSYELKYFKNNQVSENTHHSAHLSYDKRRNYKFSKNNNNNNYHNVESNYNNEIKSTQRNNPNNNGNNYTKRNGIVCKFFQQGRCNQGVNCRFLHPNNNNNQKFRNKNNNSENNKKLCYKVLR